MALQAVIEEGLFAAAVSALSHFCFDEFGAAVIDLTFLCFYACLLRDFNELLEFLVVVQEL